MRKLSVVVSAALISLGGAASPGLGGEPKNPTESASAPPIKADLDGDRIFDDLEARLAGMGPAERVSVIVALDLPATFTRLRGLEAAVGSFNATHRFSLVRGFAAELTKAQLQIFTWLPGIVHVEENSVVHAFNDSAQQSFGVTSARAAAAVDGNADGNAATYSKNDFVAAVIDTGIDAAHADLNGGKVIAFANCIGGCKLAAPLDDHGHGTHVAATIAGEGDARADLLYKGAAPGAALVGVKVLDANGSGTTADVTAGIEWVTANKDTYGIEAINLSLGSSGCSNGTDVESVAVNNAHAAGLVVAVAAGNSGPGTCTISSPAAVTDALTVGAMADMGVNGFKQAYFSSRGKTLDGRIKPDVSAPGVSITSADAGTPAGYIVFSGTSMATPFTVGTALLMLDANPTMGCAAGSAARCVSDAVKATIKGTAIDWGRGGDNKTAGTTGADVDYGAGRLDGFAAIQAAKGVVLPGAPAMPEHQLREGSLGGTGATVDYLLNVTDTQFPIGATLIHPSISGATAFSPDFDLYMLAPGGTQVAAAETSRRQDELGFKPTSTGTYTLRVKSYRGSGPYFVDISAGTSAPPSPPPPPADTTAPTVTGVSPAAGATGVATSSTVTATFSEPMDKPATQAALTLTDPTAAVVAGSSSWSGNTLMFTPSTNLAASTVYTARVTTAAKDTAGNTLAAAQTWSFTTAEAPAPPPVPAPGSASPVATTVVTGTFRSGAASNLAADDNVYYEVNSTASFWRTSEWYGTFTGVSNALSNLKISYSGKNSRSCTQTVSIWRWTTGSWVQLRSATVGTSEVAMSNLAPTGAPADYVSGTAGDGELRIRIYCRTFSGTFYSSGDLMRIAYDSP